MYYLYCMYLFVGYEPVAFSASNGIDNWHELVLQNGFPDNGKLPKPMGTALNKMKHGLIAGTRVIVGDYDKFQTTSCVRELGFLNCVHDGSSDVLQAEVAKWVLI